MLDFPSLLAPIRRADLPAAVTNADFLAWLRTVNGELGAFNEALTTFAVRGGYRNALFPASTPTVAETLVAGGTIAARIRSIFCATSAILEDTEELWIASWAMTSRGTSVVYGSHQDQREIWPVTPSIADFVLLQYREDSYFQKKLELPAAIAALPSEMGGDVLDPLWDPLALTRRVDWLVALLFPEGDWYGLGDGLDGAPAFADFLEEEPLLPGAPHLLAYWLAHHAVFGNAEAFARIRPLGEASSYPPARELAARPEWCNAPALRTAALRLREDLFEPEAIAGTKHERDRRAALRGEIQSELAKKEPSAAVMLLGALLGEATLEELDTEIIKSLRPHPPGPADADREMDTLLLAKRGNAPGLGLVFEQIPEEVDASWEPIAKALVELVALEPHGDLAKVAILYAPDAPPVDDRLGRLARVAVALRSGDEAYVHAQAKRFLDTLHARTTDTAALALEVGLARRDRVVIAALEAALEKKKPHARTMDALRAIMADDPAFAPMLERYLLRE